MPASLFLREELLEVLGNGFPMYKNPTTLAFY